MFWCRLYLGGSLHAASRECVPFQAEYAEHEALFAIETFEILEANCPVVHGRLSSNGLRSIGRNCEPIGSAPDKGYHSIQLNR